MTIEGFGEAPRVSEVLTIFYEWFGCGSCTALLDPLIDSIGGPLGRLFVELMFE